MIVRNPYPLQISPISENPETVIYKHISFHLQSAMANAKHEKTLVLVKPDGIQRGLVGEIISRFERKGLKLVGIKMIRLDDEILEEHYAHIKERPFFGEVKSFMKSSPVIAMAWEGLEAASATRKLVGITKGREAEAGSIRGDFAMSNGQNLIHASDSPENGALEVARFFKGEELLDYDKSEYLHVYGPDER
jgi:nucleoside-diphosphate kinase